MARIRAATALLLAIGLAACAGTETPRPGQPATLRIGFGTGFFVGDGLVATAAHVVRRCRRIDVWSGAVPEVQAAVQRSWRADDVALLRVRAAAPATLTLAARPASETPLRAFGYPGASGAPFADETMPRLVNGLARPGTPADPRDILWLQDAAIGHGWSGGPVLDRAGRVAGLIVSVMPDAASAGRSLQEPLPGIAIATGLDDLHLPRRAGILISDDPRRAVVHVRCVE